MLRVVSVLLIAPLVLSACHDERPNTHVYASPPPRPARPTASSVATPPATEPEPPLGTRGPGASITSVLDAMTGAPVALNDARGTVEVMTLSAFGPGDWRYTPGGRVELVMRGVRDTTFTLTLGSPPPSVVAHPFRLSLESLEPGQYSVRARLRVAAGLLVESAPLFFTVARR